MKRRNNALLVTASVVGLLLRPAALFALSVTGMDSAKDMAAALVGSGITISNVTYKGATAAAGYFSKGIASGIGIDSGIVLTSGYSKYLDSSKNSSGSASGYNYVPGDSQLGSLIPGYQTYDAAVLSFDFVSQGDAAYFNYVFGSEEYPEWVNSGYNDVFGFFVDGQNYALLPDASPVSINTVNAKENAGLYNDNTGKKTPFQLEYDGFTDVLTASLTGLAPGKTYHITLAVADAGDYGYDSGIFLEAGSFSDTAAPAASPVPELPLAFMLTLGTLVLVCPRAVRRKHARAPTP